MPRTHKDNTISFRPDEWERIMIEERAAISGMLKKEYIARSCIYSNICVVGKKTNVQKIVDAVEEMKNVISEIASRLPAGDFQMSDEGFREMSMRYVAMCVAIVDILNGASYLFGVDKPEVGSMTEREEHLRQLFESLECDCQEGD